MTRLRRPPNSAWLRRGPIIVKVLFIICIVQIIFTVYVAVRVLKSSLEPDGFVFGGLPSALSERQRDLAEVLGSLDRLDFQQPVEFIPNDVENKDQPTLRRFIMRPLSILDVARHDQELNQLIVSDNKINIEASASNISLAGQDHGPSKSLSSKFPLLKMYKIRPIDTSDHEMSSSKKEALVKENIHVTSTSNSSQQVKKLNSGRDKLEKSIHSSKNFAKEGRKPNEKPTNNKTIHRNVTTMNSSRHANNITRSSRGIPSKHIYPIQVQETQNERQFSGSGGSQKSKLKSHRMSQNLLLKNDHSLQVRSVVKLPLNGDSNLNDFPATSIMPSLQSNQKLDLIAKGLSRDQDYRISSTSLLHSSARNTPKKSINDQDRLSFVNVYSQMHPKSMKVSIKEHDLANQASASEVVVNSISRSLGQYLWTRVIGGPLMNSTIAGTLVGNKTVDGVTFVFREDLATNHVVSSLVHHSLVLVASGETEASVSAVRERLDDLASSGTTTTKLLLVLLGSPKCNNSWLEPYVAAGTVRAVLLTHDDLAVSSPRYHQWPLTAGVLATQQLAETSAPRRRVKRRYLCSLWTRRQRPSPAVSQLLTFLRPYLKRGACALLQADETSNNSSLTHYIKSLQSADLVLCPALSDGETSLIYDAIESGAVPVVVVGPAAGAGSCDTQALKLLKEMEAPFIWLDSLFELQAVLDREKTLSVEAKSVRYDALRAWYQRFKLAMSSYFVKVVRSSLV